MRRLRDAAAGRAVEHERRGAAHLHARSDARHARRSHRVQRGRGVDAAELALVEAVRDPDLIARRRRVAVDGRRHRVATARRDEQQPPHRRQLAHSCARA